MFEELSYSDNLTGTAHPRIMTTDDSSLSGDDLAALLKRALDAITADDHQKLFNIVRQVCNGVATDKTSSDVFITVVGPIPLTPWYHLLHEPNRKASQQSALHSHQLF